MDWVENVPEGTTLKSVMINYLLHVLRKREGNQTHAAADLGMSPRTLRFKIRQLRKEGYPVPEPKRGFPRGKPRKRPIHIVYSR